MAWAKCCYNPVPRHQTNKIPSVKWAMVCDFHHDNGDLRRQGSCNTWYPSDFHPKVKSRSNLLFCHCPIVLKYCAGYDSITAVLCAKFLNDLAIEMYVTWPPWNELGAKSVHVHLPCSDRAPGLCIAIKMSICYGHGAVLVQGQLLDYALAGCQVRVWPLMGTVNIGLEHSRR